MNSIIPHFGMEQADLLSSLNAIAGVNFTEHAENGQHVPSRSILHCFKALMGQET